MTVTPPLNLGDYNHTLLFFSKYAWNLPSTAPTDVNSKLSLMRVIKCGFCSRCRHETSLEAYYYYHHDYYYSLGKFNRIESPWAEMMEMRQGGSGRRSRRRCKGCWLGTVLVLYRACVPSTRFATVVSQSVNQSALPGIAQVVGWSTGLSV